MINQSSFYDMIKYDYGKIVIILLKDFQIDINEKKCVIKKKKTKEFTALHVACKYNNLDIVNLLLQQVNIDVNIKFITFLKYSSFAKKITDIKIEKTALQIAVENGNVDIVKCLLQNKQIDVNILDMDLIILYKNNSDIILGMLDLLDDKFPCEAEDISGFPDKRYFPNNIRPEFASMNIMRKTALQIAIEKKNIEIVKLLLANNEIDINLRTPYFFFSINEFGWCAISDDLSALCIAVLKENYEIVQLLLQKQGIDVNEKCKQYSWGDGTYSYCENKTALYFAANLQNSDIFKLLLSQPGIDVSIIAKYRHKSGDDDEIPLLKDESFILLKRPLLF